eukprot:4092417-Alexandrium_andersonii.AAC.1
MEEAIEQIDLKIAKIESKKEGKHEGHPNTRKLFEDACAFEQKMKKALDTKEEDVKVLREKLAVAEREAEDVKAKHASAVQLKQQALVRLAQDNGAELAKEEVSSKEAEI